MSRTHRDPRAQSILGALLALLACRPAQGENAADPATVARLAGVGIPVTAGAAPGYVADEVCRRCHTEIWDSYQEVGMARSFFRPRPERRSEDFAHARVVHAPSGQVLEMVERDGGLVFRRYQLDPEGRQVHLLEQPVDWVLGSGNHARTYLYRTPGGELYQLPIAWYTQENRWGMAPGFDRPDHDGVTRRVLRECLFCHNAYPEVAAGSDVYPADPVFPAALPEGTGCQRCHGPGAEHVDRALGGGAPVEQVRAAIVNPARLAPVERDSVCFGCHLQPSVALPGARRFGRGDYSLRPGEPLASYLVAVDVEEAGTAPAARFEINHHAYRLRQSRCFQAGAGRLSCLTCHDPHRRVPAAERAAHYRAACLGCHEAPSLAARHAGLGAAADFPASDCVSCHMPKRRPQDVVHVVMTDHRIGLHPGPAELLAPLAERDPEIVAVRLDDPATAPAGALGELYRAVALARTGASPAAADRLAELLRRSPQEDPTPALDLASAELRLRRFAAAEATLRALLARRPGLALAREWLGIAQFQGGNAADARQSFEAALPLAPERAELRFNLGLALFVQGEPAAAAARLREALALRPNLAAAWFYLGKAQEALGQGAPGDGVAAESYRRALAIQPGHAGARAALERLAAPLP